MTKLKLLGAAIVLSSTLSVPAMAQVAVSPGYSVRNAYCLSKELGNPYIPPRDYQHWSAWRAEGGWDDRGDWRCLYNSPSPLGY